jgi:hypothetical protein
MDKLLHFAVGLILALAVGTGLFYIIGCTPNFSKGSALLASILAGAWKETWDSIRAKAFNVRTWNVFDWLATCVGGFAGVLVLIVVFNIN